MKLNANTMVKSPRRKPCQVLGGISSRPLSGYVTVKIKHVQLSL